MHTKPLLAMTAVAALLSLVGCSSGSSSSSTDTSAPTTDAEVTTTTLTEAQAAGRCPNQEEKDRVTAIQAKAGGAVDDTLIAGYNEYLDIQEKYLPADLQDDLVLVRATFIAEFSKIVGMTPDALDDPSSLSPEDQARAAAYQAALSTPEFVTAVTALNDYFTTNCPDLGLS